MLVTEAVGGCHQNPQPPATPGSPPLPSWLVAFLVIPGTTWVSQDQNAFKLEAEEGCCLLVKITARNSGFGASFTGAAPVGRAGKAGELVSCH